MAQPINPTRMFPAGCVRVTHPHGTTFCGAHLETGAVVLGFEPLDPGVPVPQGPVPTASVLPAVGGDDLSPAGAHFIRTSPDCHTGAIGTVRPTDGARLAARITAPSGGLAGLVLDHVTRLVRVSAWIDGRYAGGLELAAPGG